MRRATIPGRRQRRGVILDRRARGLANAPERRSATAGELRARSGGEHRGDPPRLTRQGSMAHRVDPPVDRLKQADRDAAVDRVGAQADRGELRARQHAVLAAGPLGNLPAGTRLRFAAHFAVE
jgi:hypothetical protein